MGTGKQERYRGFVIACAPLPPTWRESPYAVARKFAARSSGRLELFAFPSAVAIQGFSDHDSEAYGALSSVVVWVNFARAIREREQTRPLMDQLIGQLEMGGFRGGHIEQPVQVLQTTSGDAGVMQRDLFGREAVTQGQGFLEQFEDLPWERGSAARECLDHIDAATGGRNDGLLIAGLGLLPRSHQGATKSAAFQDPGPAFMRNAHCLVQGCCKGRGIGTHLDLSGCQGIGGLQGTAAPDMPATTNASAGLDVESADEGAADALFSTLGLGVLQDDATSTARGALWKRHGNLLIDLLGNEAAGKWCIVGARLTAGQLRISLGFSFREGRRLELRAGKVLLQFLPQARDFGRSFFETLLQRMVCFLEFLDRLGLVTRAGCTHPLHGRARPGICSVKSVRILNPCSFIRGKS